MRSGEAPLKGAGVSRRRFPPISKKMTAVIAERDLTLPVGGRRRRVRIRIGQPVRDVETVDTFDWRCPVLVSGLGRRRSMYGVGVDSLQALVDALKALEIEVKQLESGAGSRLEAEPGLAWHGLPQIARDQLPLRLLRAFLKRTRRHC